MPVEAIRELVTDEMPEQQPSNVDRDVLMDEPEAERFPALDSFNHRIGVAAERGGVPFDQLHRRHRVPVPCRLEKAHVLGVGIEDVHLVEVDILTRRPRPR